MNFQKMYNTRVLFGTKTKYNVHVHVSYFYGMKSDFLLYVLNALSDHHLFFFSNCDIIKDYVACYVVAIQCSFIQLRSGQKQSRKSGDIDQGQLTL